MWGKRAKIDKADKMFSLYIRTRAKWKCEYCGKDYTSNHQGLHTSHYFSRAKESTRFDPANCIALCTYHHHYLGHGDGRDEYKELMIKRLGKKGFQSLTVEAMTVKKRDRKMAYIIAKKLFEEERDG